MGLGVEQQTVLSDVSIEVDGELWDSQHRSAIEHQTCFDLAVDPHLHSSGETQISIQPTVEQDTAVDLDPQLGPTGHRELRTLLHPQVG